MNTEVETQEEVKACDCFTIHTSFIVEPGIKEGSIYGKARIDKDFDMPLTFVSEKGTVDEIVKRSFANIVVSIACAYANANGKDAVVCVREFADKYLK